MRKILSIALVFILCVSLFGCSNSNGNLQNNNTDTGNNNVEGISSAESVPQRIALTKENAAEYFTFTNSTRDIIIEDEPLGNESGEGYIDITVSRKKNVEFENVVLVLKFVSESSGWQRDAENTVTVEVPFDGSAEVSAPCYSLITRFVYDKPTFTIEVMSAEGTVIE